MIFRNDRKWSDSPNEIEYQQGQAGSFSRTFMREKDEGLPMLTPKEIAYRRKIWEEIREEIRNRKAAPEAKSEAPDPKSWKKMNVKNRIPASVLKEIEAVLN